MVERGNYDVLVHLDGEPVDGRLECSHSQLCEQPLPAYIGASPSSYS